MTTDSSLVIGPYVALDSKKFPSLEIVAKHWNSCAVRDLSAIKGVYDPIVLRIDEYLTELERRQKCSQE